MCFRSFTLTIFAVVSIVFSGCGGTTVSNNSVSNTANATSANSTNTNSPGPQSPLATNKRAEAPTENAAPTLGPVVRDYYDALKRKDDAALQSILSAATLKKTTSDMKAEKQTGMAAYLAGYDIVPDKPVEVRNERIEGAKGIAEIRGGAYTNWTPFLFVNEGGKWKYTGVTPDLQAVSSQSNNNPAK